MTIARRWMKEGHSITWPVLPQFVEGLQRAYPDVTFCDYRSVKINYDRMDEHDSLGYRVVPLRWANEMLNRPYEMCMRSKYDLLQLDFKEWKEGAMWNRTEKEDELIDELGVDLSRPYTLINRFFGSNSQFKVLIEQIGVEIKTRQGFSLFDYSKLIENATHIYSANTSILFLLEMLELKAESVHLYCRKPIERDFRNIEYLFTKNYVLH